MADEVYEYPLPSNFNPKQHYGYNLLTKIRKAIGNQYVAGIDIATRRIPSRNTILVELRFESTQQQRDALDALFADPETSYDVPVITSNNYFVLRDIGEETVLAEVLAESGITGECYVFYEQSNPPDGPRDRIIVQPTQLLTNTHRRNFINAMEPVYGG